MGISNKSKKLDNLHDKSNTIFNIFAASNPEPKTELEYINLFTLLVAVSLSAQTTDAAVNKATRSLFEIAFTPALMIDLGQSDLRHYIKSLNFCNTKSRNVISMSQIILEDFKGEVPLVFDELIKLPGVGRKTANVVLNCWMKSRTMPVDTHVFRVSRRIGLATASKPGLVEQELLTNIPNQWLDRAHHWLILHGRYICKARAPQCSECTIQKHCDYFTSLI